jgi:hypothetical protein
MTDKYCLASIKVSQKSNHLKVVPLRIHRYFHILSSSHLVIYEKQCCSTTMGKWEFANQMGFPLQILGSGRPIHVLGKQL